MCFVSSRRRHTRFKCDWSSDVCSSDLGSFRAHAGMRRVPDATAGTGARIAAADAGDAGRRRTTPRAARAITREGAAVDAMGLGRGVWAGSYGGLRTPYDIYPALAAATGTGRARLGRAPRNH